MLKGFVSGEEKDIVRIPMFDNGVEHEGWEVRDNQDRLIWGREDELQTATGTLPFKGYTLPVKVKSLLGNAVQNGTPAPDNIITPEMCGVRTGNLVDESTVTQNAYMSDQGIIGSSTVSNITDYIDINASPFVISGVKTTDLMNSDTRGICFFNSNKEFIRGNSYSPDVMSSPVPFSNIPSNAKYVRFTFDKAFENGIMLNLGSTALPYEPYGWKVPFENRGENLFDPSTATLGKYINAQGVETASSSASSIERLNHSDFFAVAPNESYTLSSVKASSVQQTVAFCWYDATKTFLSRTTEQKAVGTTDYSITGIAPSDARFAIINYTTANNEVMLNLGSTPKPYSPYLNATIPVYLGEVPTVRRIKKLVLTGNEWWGKEGGVLFFNDVIVQMPAVQYADAYCSHYRLGSSYTDVAVKEAAFGVSKRPAVFFHDTRFSTVDDFKTYLQQQYAAGTPVTVWYVLATPETGIVNEPLCKISTYADELTTIGVHGLSAPLYGIGDYKDTLNLSTGVVTRKVGKLVLDGTENWLVESGMNGLFTLPNIAPQVQYADQICSHFSLASSYLNFYNNDLKFAVINRPALVIHYNAKQTVQAFKQWLADEYSVGHPVTIWYVLSTPTTETVTVPTGMTGEIEGYLTQVSTPSPTKRSVPKWNGVEETGGTYAVTVYTPPEIPTTTGQNTLTVDTSLAPSKLEVSVHAKKIHYGFKIDKSNDDSESAVIYTHDAVTMTPAHMDFTNDRFDYGSWGNAFFVRDCYPVALNLDGTIAYRLDPDDYTKKMDGTPSDIFYELLTAEPSDWSTQWKQYYTKDANDNYELNSQGSAPTFAQDTYYKLTYNSSFTGNFMMAFPKVWFYRHEDSQYNYIEISNYKLSDDWKCYAHINASGQEVDFIYLPLFKGVIKSSKLRSLPGQIPQGNTTATDEVNAATALGSRWQIWDHSSVELINDLLVLMTKSIDSQGRFGKGRESGYNSSDTVTYGKLQTGTLIKGGKFHGFSSSYKEVKVFGIEGFWANRWDRLQGMLLVNNVWKIKMTPPYNFTGTDFVTLSNASVPTGNGYLSKVQTSECGSIPASIDGGSSTKYFKDYFYKTATDTRVALRGGNCAIGAGCGFRYVGVSDAASYSRWGIGASPVYK